MPIADVVNIAISVSGAGPTRQGFGEPLIAAFHTKYSDRVREYGSLAGMVADGFAVTDPAYLAASVVFSQQPAPPFVKVGRRALAYTQVINLTCTSVTALDTYTIKLRTPGGSWQTVTTPSTGVPATDVATLNTLVTALAISGLTATHATTVLTLTMASGKLLDVQSDLAHMTLADATTDPGIATDLAAILAADSNWYGLLLDSNSPAEILAAAAWTEANNKLGGFQAADSAIGTSATGDVASMMKTNGYARCYGFWSPTVLLSYVAAGIMGRMLPTDPGSENWAFKSIAAVPADVLTDNAIHYVEGKNWSVYTPLAGLNLTQFGRQPSGQWIDITRGTDWIRSSMQTQILGLLANNSKIPFTDAGIDTIRATMIGVLTEGVNIGFLSSNPAPFVSLPTASAVDPINKAARNLPNVSFTAKLAGAVNSLSITGVLSA